MRLVLFYIILIAFAFLIDTKAAPTELSVQLIKQYEGYKSTAYFDTSGYATIGWGTNISFITKSEANFLLYSRLHIIDTKLHIMYKWYSQLPYIPQSIVLNMAYNLGTRGFSRFRKMHYQLARHNWVKAAIEMKSSLWYKQTKGRSKYLYNLMRNYKD